MFIGKSSSGKDTFFYRTINNFNLNKILLLTTRPKRLGEEEGKEYNFIDMDTMDELDKNHLLVERRDYNTAYGIWSYATRGDIIDTSKNYLVCNTWQGYEQYLNYFGEGIVYPFYFDLNINTRFERAYVREHKQENKKYLEMCRRFIADEEDFKNEYLTKYNPIIIDNNGTMEETEEQISYHVKKLIIK